jgi:hypothetical protein
MAEIAWGVSTMTLPQHLDTFTRTVSSEWGSTISLP